MKNLLLFLAIICIAMFSCKKEFHKNTEIQKSSISIDKQNAEEAFGKAFAKSLSNQKLREIIKSEALKKFDNDFDILYATIKDEKLENGQTVQQLVESNYDKGVGKNVLSVVPTLTIFVPNLGFFSADEWNYKNIIPQVAVAHATSDKLNDKIRTFTSLGTETNLSYLQKPIVPTIVIKENERVDAISTGKEELSENSSSFTFKYKDAVFENKSFMHAVQKSSIKTKPLILNASSSLNNEIIKNKETDRDGGARNPSPNNPVHIPSNEEIVGDSVVYYAVNKNLKPQRDYIYYDIDTSANKG